MARERPRIVRWLLTCAQNTALVLASLLVTFAICEVAVRLFTDTPPMIGERDPLIGKRHQRNFSASIFVAEAQRKVSMRFNNEGFRGGDVTKIPEPGEHRIAVLGDSMVVSSATDEEDSAVVQLQSMLENSHPTQRWTVMNFGVSGASTGQELVLYREIAAQYQPDIVLLAYFNGNDFSDNSHQMSSNPRIYFELNSDAELVQVPSSASRRLTSAWLNRNSKFYVWLKRSNDILKRHTDDGILIFHKDPDEMLQGVWELNERLILALAREVAARGSRFIVVIFPTGPQVYDDIWLSSLEQAGHPPDQFDPDYPEQRLAALGERHGIPVLSLRAEFRRVAGGRTAADTPAAELLFFRGYGHFTERGNELAARIVHRYLSRGGGREILEQIQAPDGGGGAEAPTP